MNKKFLKTLSLMSLILLFSVNMVFAYDNVEVNQPNSSTYDMKDSLSNSKTDVDIMRATVFEVHGGHGEWGYGRYNMWGKYWHMEKSHRVVLSKDNSNIYGAWEDGGPTASYRETSKGSDMDATGEVR